MEKVYVVVKTTKIGFDGYYGPITVETGEAAFKSKNSAEEYIKKLENSPEFNESKIRYEIWELELKD